MAREIYILGLIVSIISILVWPSLILSQLRQFNKNPLHNKIKYALLVFGVVAFASNFAPAWYDVYRIIHPSAPGPITFLKIASDIIFRATATLSFFVIYNYNPSKE